MKTMNRRWSRHTRTKTARQVIANDPTLGFLYNETVLAYGKRMLIALGLSCEQWQSLDRGAKNAYLSQLDYRGYSQQTGFAIDVWVPADGHVDDSRIRAIDAYCARRNYKMLGAQTVGYGVPVQNYFGNTGAPYVMQYGIPTQNPFGIISPESLFGPKPGSFLRPAGQGMTPTQGAYALIAVALAFAVGAAYVGSRV